MEPSMILVVVGMVGLSVACIVGLLCGSKMLELLRVTDPSLHSKLQVGAGVQLLVSPSSIESQRFILNKKYKDHSHAPVRALGHKVHSAFYAAVVFAVVAVIGFVMHAVAR
jgi:hypothetical protein